jgi:RNA-directed DNA polymerase
MSLTTPEEIRSLQRNLYAKAKKEPDFRFYSLYDKVYRTDILAHAYLLAKANKGAEGVDGMTFEAIESLGLGEWLVRLQEDLRTRQYKPEAVRRVVIPKPGGGERPLGIPTIRDRVVQTAASLVLTPIFEADFGEEMHGYRPGRNAQDAVKTVHQALKEGYTDVVDGDLSKYFDSIPHFELLRSVARRVSDGAMLHVIKLWLKAPIEETNKAGRKRRTGGRHNTKGTPQGGVISPLLANIYMNRFLKAWKERGMGQRLQAKVVVYADDFVILCKGTAEEALAVTKRWMTALKLTLNEKKTCLRNAQVEHFDFLGYTFGPTMHRPTGRSYLGVTPSQKAVGRLRDRMRQIMQPANQDTWDEIVVRANRVILGWARYFSYGAVTRPYWKVDAFMLRRARVFLTRRHKDPGQGSRRYPPSKVFGPGGLVCLADWRRRASATSHALA